MKKIEEMSNQELINLTISALNCGDYSALEDADKAKKEAKRRRDIELINHLEHLWKVI